MASIGFQQIKLSPTEIQFQIRNPSENKATLYFPSMANAIRRTILSDLPNYLPSRNLMSFQTCTSMIHQDMLSLRFHLCPIRILSVFENSSDITLFANISNETAQIQDVLLKQITIQRKEEQVSPEEFWTNPDILFTRLKPGQKIEFSCPVEFGSSSSKNAGFQPCAAVRYIFTTKPEEMDSIISTKTFATPEDELSFRKGHAEQAIWKNKEEQPMEYQFFMENIGCYPSQEVIPTALFIIGKRFQRMSSLFTLLLNQKIEFPTIPKQMIVSPYNGTYRAFDITIYNETETTVDHWTQYVRRDPDVEYVGYRIPHPMDPIIVIRIALKQQPTDTMEYVSNCLMKLKEHTEQLYSFWETQREEWWKQCPEKKTPKWDAWMEEIIYQILPQ